jgi:hypothetical protein
MPTVMSQMRRVANAHMKRNMEAGRKWVCECEDCRGMRSLVGVDKLLEVRPLVREITQVEEQLGELPHGPEMSELLGRFLALHDKLADVMAQ